MIDLSTTLLRLTVAVVLGAAIGVERERVESAAGLRTHALVCLGSALVVIVSSFGFRDAGRAPDVVLDPSRVAAQVISGIGFLGAGVIIFRKEIVRGLTTAASLWVVAAVGLAVGGGVYAAAVATTVLSLAILAVMKPLERRLTASRRRQLVTVVLDRKQTTLGELRAAVEATGVVIETINARLTSDPSKDRCDLVLRNATTTRLLALLDDLSAREGVRDVRSSVAVRNEPAQRARRGGPRLSRSRREEAEPSLEDDGA